MYKRAQVYFGLDFIGIEDLRFVKFFRSCFCLFVIWKENRLISIISKTFYFYFSSEFFKYDVKRWRSVRFLFRTGNKAAIHWLAWNYTVAMISVLCPHRSATISIVFANNSVPCKIRNRYEHFAHCESRIPCNIIENIYGVYCFM